MLWAWLALLALYERSDCVCLRAAGQAHAGNRLPGGMRETLIQGPDPKAALAVFHDAER